MRLAAIAALPVLLACASRARESANPQATAGEWTAYGKDVFGSRHSGLTQIDTSNVARLQVAWTYHTGEVGPQVQTRNPRRSLEATPIVVDGVMYLITPLGRVIALDPETGRERWVYDARIDRTIGFGDHTSRGVSAWLDPSRARASRVAGASSPRSSTPGCCRSTPRRESCARTSATRAPSICGAGCAIRR